MLNQPIGNLKDTGKVVTAAPQASVAEAVAMMLAHGVTAIVVVENDAISGIFTEHDVVTRVIAVGRDPQAVRLDEVMTREPLTLAPDATLGRAIVLMQEHAIRHLPVVKNGKLVGLVCQRDALDPTLEDFVSEARRRESFR
jgi:CBS domain-containing protein